MKAKQIVLVGLGFLFMALGLLGALLPVLPTTPFVLLAAGCFSASSQRLYNILLQNRILGPYLENYRTGKGITRSRKLFAIAFLWCGLLVSMLLARSLMVCIVLGVVGVCVTVHLSMIKNKVE